MNHLHYTPIIVPVIISGSWYSWTGGSYPMDGIITVTPQEWIPKTEQGTSKTTKKIVHIRSRCAINIPLTYNALVQGGIQAWRNRRMQKIYAGDKDVTFVVDTIDDVSFATSLTTKVYLPEGKNTTIPVNAPITTDGSIEFFPLPGGLKAYGFVSASPDNGVTWQSAASLQWGSNSPDYNDKLILNDSFTVKFPTLPPAGTVLIKYIPLATIVDWPTEVYNKHYLRIHAIEIDNLTGWMRLQPEIVSPAEKAKCFETIEIMISPKGT